MPTLSIPLPPGSSATPYNHNDKSRSGRSFVTMRGLIADFGGVLTLDFYEVLREFARREGLQEDALINEVSDDPVGKRLLADVEAGVISQREFQAALAPRLGVEEEGLVARICAPLEPDMAMISATTRLHDSGVPCAILSNSWGTDPHNPYTAWQLDQNWDVIVYSHEVNLRKPSPEIYALAAERLGVDPALCVFIDDTAHNLPGAERVGMTAIHHVGSVSTIALLEDLFRIELGEHNAC